MIRVVVDNKSIEVTGHAPREEGATENLVCAAVSALTLTTLDAMEEIAYTNIKRIEERSGHVYVKYGALDTMSATIIRTFILGVSRIADSYPGTMEVVDNLDFELKR